jgi:hypothetical protein
MTEKELPASAASSKSSGCPTCGMDLVFSAYFDRFGFNMEKNEANASNIGMLWKLLSFRNGVEITKETSALRTTMNYKYYVSGLGTPFKSEDTLTTGAAVVLASASDTVRDAPKGTAKDKAKEIGKDAFEKGSVRQAINAALKKDTGLSLSGWRANWGDFIKQRSIASASGVSAKQASRAARLARKHLDDGLKGVGKYGKTVAKGVAKEVVKAAVFAAADSTDLADIKEVSRTLRSGYKKRVEGAWEALKKAITLRKNDIKPPSMSCCGEVRVFIFGAEWGGSLARIFANKVVSGCSSKSGRLYYDEIPVRICFVGLFDCANSVSPKRAIGTALDLLPWNPITTSLDGTELPREVEAALHVYSTHERGYLLSSLDGGKAGEQAEQALPGIAADVCGGRMLKGEYGLAQLEIAKYALCQMHACAKSYGAPFAQPDDGTPQAEALEKALEPSFLLNGEDIYTHLPHYIEATGTADAEPEEALRNATETYVKWLRMLYDESDEGRDLDAILASSAGEKSSAFMAAMKQQVRAARPEAERGRQLVGKAIEHRLGAVWESGEHLDDLFLSQFLVAYTHFNSPGVPLSFREIEG